MLRMKEYENKLDYMEKRMRVLEEKLGVVPAQVPQVVDVVQDVPNAVTTVTADKAVVSSVNPEGANSLKDQSAESKNDTNEKTVHQDMHEADNIATLKAQSMPTPALGGGKTDVVAQYDQAMKFLNSKEEHAQEKAIEAFEEIINTYPDDVYAHKSYVHAAQACMNSKNYEKAIAYYKVALLKNLDVSLAITVRIGYAKALNANGSAQEACKQLGFLKKQEMDVMQKQDYDALSNTVCKPKKAKS
jgi:TolA-binding protein